MHLPAPSTRLTRPVPCSLGGLEPSLLFDGPSTFSVAEGDESGAEYELGEAAMGGAGLFAPQRPGVPSQRAAPTRQRTPTVRHAPAALAAAGGRRLAPPGVQTYVAPTAAKSANASSAALMPPPPPRASARAAAAAVVPTAAAAGPASLSRCVRLRALLRLSRSGTHAAHACRSPEAQARTSSGRRTTSTNVTARPMLRRVQSTGDLHAYNAQASLRSPLHAVMEGGLPLGTQDDGVYRIGAEHHAKARMRLCVFDVVVRYAGKYTLEERRMRILRYRQKRHVRAASALRRTGVFLTLNSCAQERNFERKIKYSCRKVLADSRPRVRGRFAKNEDNAAPKLDPDDFDFMDDGLLEDEHSGDQPGGPFEHASGASTTGRSGGEERQSALASVFAV